MVDASSLIQPRKVTADGEGLVSRAGLVVLDHMADGTGLTEGFRSVFGSWPRRRLDPGDGYAQVVIGLDGASCLLDVTGLSRSGLFAEAASNTTRWDWVNRITTTELVGIRQARAAARAKAWAHGAGPASSTMIVDIDATIITGSDGKQDSAGTWKGTWGHHPLVAVVADTGEVLGGLVRPGNAGSNTAADHVELLDQMIGSLPEAWQVGHRFADRQPGDTTIVIRTDTAGYSAWLIEDCQARNLEFSIGHPVTQTVRDALDLVQEEHWIPARNSDGEARSGAQVTD